MSTDEIREHLEKERLTQERRAAWGKLRSAIDACERFATPEDAQWGGGTPLVVEERSRRLDPCMEGWPSINRRFSRLWVSRWKEAAKWTRFLGLEESIVGVAPDDPALRTMHELFVSLLRGAAMRQVGEDLANLRKACEADYLNLPPEVTRPRYVIRGRRYELGKYFGWLRDQAQRMSSTDGQEAREDLPETPARSVMTDKEAAVWDLLMKLPADRCLTGPAIVEHLRENGIITDESYLRSRIIPPLRERGVENQPRVGYYIPQNVRERIGRA